MLICPTCLARSLTEATRKYIKETKAAKREARRKARKHRS